MKFIFCAFGVLALAQSANAETVLWDNELTPNGENFRNVTRGIATTGPFPFIVAENFTLQTRSVISEFQWNALTLFESQAVANTATVDLWLYQDNSGDGSTAPSNGTHIGEYQFSSAETGLILFNGIYGTNYNHLVGGLQIELDKGSYFIGLHANLDPGVTGEMFWAASDGGQGAGTYGWGLHTVIPGTFEKTGDDFSFVLSGEIVPVPEPPSLVLLLSGMLGICFVRAEIRENKWGLR